MVKGYISDFIVDNAEEERLIENEKSILRELCTKYDSRGVEIEPVMKKNKRGKETLSFQVRAMPMEKDGPHVEIQEKIAEQKIKLKNYQNIY